MKEGNSLLRIKFSKHGLMKFIGHLDTMRYFQKCIRRAGLDAAYSEGFHPHQIMSFAQPLSVGVESNGEYFDLEVRSVTDSEDMIRRMNDTGAEGIEVLDMVRLPEKTPKAMASVFAADYTVSFRPGHEPEWDISAGVRLFKDSPSVTVRKKSKKQVREIELKALVYSLEILKGEAGNPVLSMRLNASSGENVKPALLIRTLRGLADPGFDPDSDEEYPLFTSILITREEIFDKDMKPLIEAGVQF